MIFELSCKVDICLKAATKLFFLLLPSVCDVTSPGTSMNNLGANKCRTYTLLALCIISIQNGDKIVQQTKNKSNSPPSRFLYSRRMKYRCQNDSIRPSSIGWNPFHSTRALLLDSKRKKKILSIVCSNQRYTRIVTLNFIQNRILHSSHIFPQKIKIKAKKKM